MHGRMSLLIAPAPRLAGVVSNEPCGLKHLVVQGRFGFEFVQRRARES